MAIVLRDLHGRIAIGDASIQGRMIDWALQEATRIMARETNLCRAFFAATMAANAAWAVLTLPTAPASPDLAFPDPTGVNAPVVATAGPDGTTPTTGLMPDWLIRVEEVEIQDVDTLQYLPLPPSSAWMQEKMRYQAPHINDPDLTTGRPVGWWVRDQVLYLYPAADQLYQIRLKAAHVPQGDFDIAPLPQDAVEPLICLAKALLFQADGQEDKYQKYLRYYEREVPGLRTLADTGESNQGQHVYDGLSGRGGELWQT